jgi:hypothetical protein
VALLNVDGWLNLPAKRFSREQPGEHFYRYALRLDAARHPVAQVGNS